jgi:molecular chaperone HtpG
LLKYDASVLSSDRSAFGPQIQQFLCEFNIGKNYDIFINANKTSIVRPFQSDFEAKKGIKNSLAKLDTFQIPGVNEGIDAIGWILHHDYLGALSDHLGMKGLRIRVGNIQIGDANTLQGAFPESRFNSWAIGEVHILNPRLVPNGRRDDFEQNIHYANLLTHIAPTAKSIARACRNRSAERAHNRTQSIPPSNGMNGSKIDWAKASGFLAHHAHKPITTIHRTNLKKLVRNGTPTYTQVMRAIIDSGAPHYPIPKK